MRYVQTANSQKNALSTSLRSEIHATDSTWIGCTANTAATKKLRPIAPVRLAIRPNSSNVLARCNKTLATCCASGPGPNSSTTNACESIVTGCQLPAAFAVDAHLTVSAVSPARTCAFSDT